MMAASMSHDGSRTRRMRMWITGLILTGDGGRSELAKPGYDSDEEYELRLYVYMKQMRSLRLLTTLALPSCYWTIKLQYTLSEPLVILCSAPFHNRHEIAQDCEDTVHSRSTSHLNRSQETLYEVSACLLCSERSM